MGLHAGPGDLRRRRRPRGPGGGAGPARDRGHGCAGAARPVAAVDRRARSGRRTRRAAPLPARAARRSARLSLTNGSRTIASTTAVGLRPPQARDAAVDEERRQRVAVPRDDERPMLVADHPRPVGVGEQEAVPHRQEARRAPDVAGRDAGLRRGRAARGRARPSSAAARPPRRSRRWPAGAARSARPDHAAMSAAVAGPNAAR